MDAHAVATTGLALVWQADSGAWPDLVGTFARSSLSADRIYEASAAAVEPGKRRPQEG